MEGRGYVYRAFSTERFFVANRTQYSAVHVVFMTRFCRFGIRETTKALSEAL